jgi:outer membrane cobalamin receptor
MLEGDLILDFRVGYHINENVSVSFIIDNLLNREYQIRPADLGPPRKFTFKLAAKI